MKYFPIEIANKRTHKNGIGPASKKSNKDYAVKTKSIYKCKSKYTDGLKMKLKKEREYKWLKYVNLLN
jgi:hypothetical protein